MATIPSENLLSVLSIGIRVHRVSFLFVNPSYPYFLASTKEGKVQLFAPYTHPITVTAGDKVQISCQAPRKRLHYHSRYSGTTSLTSISTTAAC